MQLRDFIEQVAGFDRLQQPDKIKLFAWYLHSCRKVEHFGNGDIRKCYAELHLVAPDVTVYLPRLAAKKPPELIKDARGYRLEGRVRRALDAKYGEQPTTVAVTSALAELPGKIPTLSEQVFLVETLACYRVQAFRAAIVMAWNLAYAHLLEWLLTDATRLGQFNSAIPRRYPKRAGFAVNTRDDFDEFKESELLEVAKNAGLYSKDVGKILSQKLDRRNTAAHPSSVHIQKSQADDVILDLVNNVVLHLKV